MHGRGKKSDEKEDGKEAIFGRLPTTEKTKAISADPLNKGWLRRDVKCFAWGCRSRFMEYDIGSG